MNISKTQKQHLVHNVFASIVERYELLNTILSMGQDRYWRKKTVEIAAILPNQMVIDLCTGTGSLAAEIAKRLDTGKVIGVDFCEEMLLKAKETINNSQYKGKIEFVNGLAEDIPFDDNIFDCATIAFGLRNVDNIQQTFREMYRVTRHGGKIISLEFVVPSSRIIKWLYYPYLKWILPIIGQLFSKKKIPYQYLSDSISGFMSSQELAAVMTGVGLKNVGWHNLSGGVVVIHVGYK